MTVVSVPTYMPKSTTPGHAITQYNTPPKAIHDSIPFNRPLFQDVYQSPAAAGGGATLSDGAGKPDTVHTIEVVPNKIADALQRTADAVKDEMVQVTASDVLELIGQVEGRSRRRDIRGKIYTPNPDGKPRVRVQIPAPIRVGATVRLHMSVVDKLYRAWEENPMTRRQLDPNRRLQHWTATVYKVARIWFEPPRVMHNVLELPGTFREQVIDDKQYDSHSYTYTVRAIQRAPQTSKRSGLWNVTNPTGSSVKHGIYDLSKLSAAEHATYIDTKLTNHERLQALKSHLVSTDTLEWKWSKPNQFRGRLRRGHIQLIEDHIELANPGDTIDAANFNTIGTHDATDSTGTTDANTVSLGQVIVDAVKNFKSSRSVMGQIRSAINMEPKSSQLNEDIMQQVEVGVKKLMVAEEKRRSDEYKAAKLR